MQLLQLDLHVLAQLLVERAQRFVHQHQLRLEHQCAGQGHALLLATRQLRRVAARHALQPHHGQRPLHPLGLLGFGYTAHRQRVGHVVAHRHVRKQRVVLEHHAEIALVRRGAGDGLAVEQDLAGGGRLEAGQHHQRGGLARARGAQQRQELAAADVQVELAHHQVHAVVGLLHADKADQRLGREGGGAQAAGGRGLAGGGGFGEGGHGDVQATAAKLSASTCRPSSISASDAVSGTRMRITLP